MKTEELSPAALVLQGLSRGLMYIALALMFILGLTLRESTGSQPYFTPLDDDVEVREMADPPPDPEDPEEHLALLSLSPRTVEELDSGYGRNPYLRL